MGIASFAYVNFDRVGRLFLAIYKSLPRQLEAANIRLYPEVYTSVVALFVLISAIVMLPVAFLGAIFIAPNFLAALIAPLFVFAFLMVLPVFKSHTRAFNLESEVPYAAAYVSVMSTGGISPYKAIKRLKNVKLLPSLAEAAQLMSVDVEAIGMDPVSAMEKMAKSLPSPDFKDLLLGYASTLSVGGDIVHFLQRKAFNIFENRARQMRSIGERIALVMEGYAITVILMALGLYILFIISQILPTTGNLFSTGNFILFAYIVLPFLTFMFIFLLDMYMPRYPVSDWRPYIAFANSALVAIVLAVFMVLPYYTPGFPSPFSPLLNWMKGLLALQEGDMPAIALGLAFIVMFLPPAIVHQKISGETSEVGVQTVSFLRDMVETRKTGIAPEKCIQLLVKRDYGRFTKRLQRIASRVSWGISFDEILRDELKKARNWFVSINIFLLIDSIDVGGGTPDTLEALESFGEQILVLDKEKKGTLRPLLLIPYVGGITTLMTAAVFLTFVQGLAASSHFAFSFTTFAELFLPPIVINTVLAGLVAGKAAGEKISAGFLHCTILAVLVIVVIALSPSLLKGFGPLGGA
jgi:flagellar protein FlaJ